MRKSRLKKHIQDKLMEHFVAGTIARCTDELLGVNHKTAGYYYRRLREIIAHPLDQESPDVFGREIEKLMSPILEALVKASQVAELVAKYLSLVF